MTHRQAGFESISHRCKSVVAFLLGAACIMALPADAVTAELTKLAIFDFELEDVSAAVPSAGATPSDAKQQLASVTSEIRGLLLVESRRGPVDQGSAAGERSAIAARHGPDGFSARRQ